MPEDCRGVNNPAGIEKRKIIKYAGSCAVETDDEVIEEKPLDINVNGSRLFFSMRLPGMDRQFASGLLFSEGIINRPDDILAYEEHNNAVFFKVKGNPSGPVKKIYSSSGSILSSEIKMPVKSNKCSITPGELFILKDKFLPMQKLFNLTGGTHAAALLDCNKNFISFAEDVGRHNALDKCMGAALLSGAGESIGIVLLSSRLSFEMVRKGYRTGATVIIGMSAPTTAAIDAARACGITLIGFLRNGRFNRYTG